MITLLRSACATIGSAHLGFDPSEIGTHSLHSGAAMEMYLAGVPVYTIMLMGRWSSNAFLHYIRKKVNQFLQDVAKKMLTHRLFQTIPDSAPCVVSNKDPRRHNHRDDAETRRNIGRDAFRRVQLPAFSLEQFLFVIFRKWVLVQILHMSHKRGCSRCMHLIRYYSYVCPSILPLKVGEYPASVRR